MLSSFRQLALLAPDLQQSRHCRRSAHHSQSFTGSPTCFTASSASKLSLPLESSMMHFCALSLFHKIFLFRVFHGPNFFCQCPESSSTPRISPLLPLVFLPLTSCLVPSTVSATALVLRTVTATFRTVIVTHLCCWGSTIFSSCFPPLSSRLKILSLRHREPEIMLRSQTDHVQNTVPSSSPLHTCLSPSAPVST